jgi:5'/3'-nucleotidase SurE
VTSTLSRPLRNERRCTQSHLGRPLRIRQIDDRHWTVDGTPTDCVTLALNKILPAEALPDVCASGINHGGNLGDDATYSGTVAGALEATILGVPGLAFSLVARENFDFREAAQFAIVAVRKVLAEGLPEGTLLNINFRLKRSKVFASPDRASRTHARLSVNTSIRAASLISGSGKSTSATTPQTEQTITRLSWVISQ